MENSFFSISKKELTIIKGIAIIFVLLGHLQIIWWGGAPAVALFLVASGYGIHESFCSNGLNGYWKKKIQKVYLPYLIAAIINLLACYPAPIESIWITLLGLNFDRNLDGTMWYISYIFFWYALFYLSCLVAEKIKTKRLAADLTQLCILAAAAYCCTNYLGPVFGINSGSTYYSWFFPLGVLLSDFKQAANHGISESGQKAVVSAVFAASAAYLLRRYGINFFAVKTTAATALFVICAVKLVPLHPNIEKLLLWLGKYSYGIYLWEAHIIYSGSRWFPALNDTTVQPFLSVALAFFIGYAYMEGIFQPIYRFLFSQKETIGPQ